MIRRPLFYQRIAALSRQRHGKLRLRSRDRYRFARGANAVVLTAVEFQRAMREYPIVFVTEDDAVMPVAVLGLRSEQNLFVSASGTWTAEYVPAYVRRYPFILATVEGSDQVTVCLDESYGELDGEEGERLFLDDGARSPFLEQAIQLLREYHMEFDRTRDFAERLSSFGLLEPLQANIRLDAGDRLSLGGFLAVKRERLAELAPEILAELVADGSLEAVYAHLGSLTNFGRLVDRLAAAA